jgi:glycerophosphoryl diester phosphodiesterase
VSRPPERPAGSQLAGGRSAVSRPLVIAHRGDHRTQPENTLPAFATALALPSCDGLEFDVHRSADGVPVVIHDESLRRVQGIDRLVADLDAAALGELGVPTLAAVLALAPAPVFLDVELKVDGGNAVADVLRAARGPELGAAVISSFEVAALEAIRRLEPGWRLWLNAEDLSAATVGLARELGCRGISAWTDAIDEAGTERVATAGLELAAWTVTDVADLRRLAALGVVAVCAEGAALDAGGGAVIA